MNLQDVLRFIASPVDYFRDEACATDIQGGACTALSALSEAMGGENTQQQALTLDLTAKPLLQQIIADSRPARVGCYTQRIETFTRHLDTLRHVEPSTVTGCYITEEVVRTPTRPLLPQPTHRLRNLQHLESLRIPERTIPAGCYFEMHTYRQINPRPRN